MLTYVNLTLSDSLTFVNLPTDIDATRVAITASFGAPGDLIFLLSDIVKPQPFNTVLKPILGHIPTGENCHRILHQTKFSQFFIKLESDGKPYSPSTAFHVELKFE